MENLNKVISTKKYGETDIVNSRKKGSFLEWIAKRIFQTVGFYATNTAIINNNQIDVFVDYNDVKILVQCKQYEKSTPPVKDLIHEWNSKRMDIECDKALLMLWGYPKIEENELKLAKKLKVYLWNDSIITYFFDLILSDKNKAKREILLNLEINSEEVQKIIDSIKEELEKRFKDFSLENKELVNSLKGEIINCYKEGVLIKRKKFEIIWEFLKDRKYHIAPDAIYGGPNDEGDYTIIRSDSDFDIFSDDEKLYRPGVIGVSLYSRGELAIDGRSILNCRRIFE